jgi:hypothetical protein
MRIMIEPTRTIVEVENMGKPGAVPARIWTGVTDDGVSVELCVTRVAVSKDYPPEVHERFRTELHEQAVPVRPQAFDLRLLL